MEGNGPSSTTVIHNEDATGVQKHALDRIHTQLQEGRPASVHLASAEILFHHQVCGSRSLGTQVRELKFPVALTLARYRTRLAILASPTHRLM